MAMTNRNSFDSHHGIPAFFVIVSISVEIQRKVERKPEPQIIENDLMND